MKTCPGTLLVFAAFAAACSNSGSGQPLLAAATIGPEGGTVSVDTGIQAGLRLSIPAGALTKATEIKVRDATPLPPLDTGVAATSFLAPPNQPFLIEPAGLRLEERATLRAPYLTTRLRNTAPGNVRARETRNGIPIEYVPEVVDIQAGACELPIRYLGLYQVVQGPVAEQGIASFKPATGSTVQFADGISLTVEEVDPGSPFAGEGAVRWRITRTPLFGQPPTDLLYFQADELRGRESTLENWRETWSMPYSPWNQAEASLPGAAVTMPTNVQSPMGGLGIGGLITVFGVWSWSAPVKIGEQQFLDVVQLRLSLAWDRQDLGVGQREYRFLFAPGLGFLAFIEDGVVHLRLPA